MHHQYQQHHQQTQSSATFSQTSRLPKIGDPLKWSMWFGLFQTTVHNQPVSDAEHLQTLTIVKANQSIAGLARNSAMYATALQKLQRRFGRPDIIVNNFIKRL